MANRFWVGGSGTWTTAATTNWSTTSGGAGGASAPTAADDVIVDGSSGSPTITIDTATTPVCRSLTTTGATVAFSFQNSASAHLNIGDASGGAMTLSATTSFTNLSSSSDALKFVSTSNNGGTGWSITTNGVTLPTMTFNGTGGGWILGGNLNVSTSGTGLITLLAGSLDTTTNNYSMTSWGFNSSGSGVRSFTGNSSTLNFSATSTGWNCSTANNLTLSVASTTINLTGGSQFAQGAPLSGGSFGTVNITGAGSPVFNVTSSVSFDTVSRTGTAVTTDGIQFNSNPTINNLILGGNTTQGSQRLLVASNLIGTQHTLTCNGTVTINGDVNFQDINIAGTGTWSNTGSAFVGDCQGNSGLVTSNFTTAVQQQYGGAHLTGSSLSLPGSAGEYASTPNASWNQITGDLDLRLKVAMNTWVPASSQAFISKWGNAGVRSYEFGMLSNGRPYLVLSQDGTTAIESDGSVGTGFTAGSTNWIRATFSASTTTVIFYTSSDGVTWSQLGVSRITTATSIFAGAGEVEVGNRQGTGFALSGNVYTVQILNGIGGSVVFNADFTAPSAYTKSFTESSTNASTVTVIAGGGNWDDATKWTTRAPLPQDDVIIGANASGTITTTMPVLGHNIDFSAFPGTITNTGGAGTVTIYGNWSQYNKSYGTGNTLALGGRGNQTYTSNGGSLTQQIRLRAVGGTYTFVDDLTSGRGDIAIVTDSGTCTFQGNVTIPGFQGSAVRECTINMGNGTWTLTSTAAETLWTTNNANVTLNAQGSNIVIATASSNNRFISGGAFGALPPITYSNASTGSLIFTGTTPSFLGLTVGAGETITFTSGITYNIAAFNVSGASGNLTTINSTTPGTAGTLNYTGTGVVSCNYLTIQDSLPVQTNTWYAGSNSTLVSNTGNWIPATPLFATISVIDSLTVSSIVQAIMPNSTLANIVTLLINPIVQAVLGLTSFAALVTLTILDKILDPYNLESTTITLESTNVNVPMQEKNVSVSMQNKNVSVKL